MKYRWLLANLSLFRYKYDCFPIHMEFCSTFPMFLIILCKCNSHTFQLRLLSDLNFSSLISIYFYTSLDFDFSHRILCIAVIKAWKLTKANPRDGSGHKFIRVSALVSGLFTMYLISVFRRSIISVVLGVTMRSIMCHLKLFC